MVRYLFLTAGSWTIEGSGRNVLDAKKDAEKNIRMIARNLKKAGQKLPVNYDGMVAYDTFNRQGLSNYNWKIIPKKQVK